MKFASQDKMLHVLENGVNDPRMLIADIVERGGKEDAFYICNVDEIIRNLKVFKAKFPQFHLNYAVKCNDNLTLIEILSASGATFTCSSKSHINKTLSLDVDADKILLDNPTKLASNIRHAANFGVKNLSFESETELEKINQFHPLAKLLVKVKVEESITDAAQVLLEAKSLGLDVIGARFYSEVAKNKEVKFYQRACESARDLFDFAATLGFNFTMLEFSIDFGDSFEQISEILASTVESLFPKTSISIDASRFLVDSAFTLACNITTIRTTPTEHRMYYINDGVYGSFGKILTDSCILNVKPLKKDVTKKLFSSSVWGPTCDDLDNVVAEVLLPELEVGDWLVFEEMGAYTVSAASGFNGFPTPSVHVAASEDIWMRLKTLLPLLEERLETENIPDFSINQPFEPSQDWNLPSLPITVKLPSRGESPLMIEEYALDYVDTCTAE